MSQAATTRPYARGRDRRDHLLVEAARLFARFGYEGTTVSAIAQAAGMTDGGVLHHFGSKANLYLAVMQGRVTQDEVDTMLSPDSDLADTVAVMIDYVRWAAEHPDMLRFRAVVSGEALLEGNPAREVLVTEHERALPLLVQKVSRAQAAGTIRADLDAEQVVLELMAVNEGLRHLAVSNPGTFDYAGVFEAAARRWLRGLTATATPAR
jgi:AcrR family transcriptional regulator